MKIPTAKSLSEIPHGTPEDDQEYLEKLHLFLGKKVAASYRREIEKQIEFRPSIQEELQIIINRL